MPISHADLQHSRSRQNPWNALTKPAATHCAEVDSVSSARESRANQIPALDGSRCAASQEIARQAPQIGDTTMRTKVQRGQIFRSGKSWYGRWRRDELETNPDGSRVVVR